MLNTPQDHQKRSAQQNTGFPVYSKSQEVRVSVCQYPCRFSPSQSPISKVRNIFTVLLPNTTRVIVWVMTSEDPGVSYQRSNPNSYGFDMKIASMSDPNEDENPKISAHVRSSVRTNPLWQGWCIIPSTLSRMLVSRASVPDIKTENLSGYTREVEQNTNQASVLTEHTLLSREQVCRPSLLIDASMSFDPMNRNSENPSTSILLWHNSLPYTMWTSRTRAPSFPLVLVSLMNSSLLIQPKTTSGLHGRLRNP